MFISQPRRLGNNYQALPCASLCGLREKSFGKTFYSALPCASPFGLRKKSFLTIFSNERLKYML